MRAIVLLSTLLLSQSAPLRAEPLLPLFDAHLHYNWEPTPRLSLDRRSNGGVYLKSIPSVFLLGSDTWIAERLFRQ